MGVSNSAEREPVVELRRRLSALERGIARRDRRIDELEARLAERDATIAELRSDAALPGDEIKS